MGELAYWHVSDVHRTGCRQEQLPPLRDLRFRLRDECTKRHLVWIVTLEGPSEVVGAADGLRRSTAPPCDALWAALEGNAGALPREDTYECMENIV